MHVPVPVPVPRNIIIKSLSFCFRHQLKNVTKLVKITSHIYRTIPGDDLIKKTLAYVTLTTIDGIIFYE